MVPSLLLLAACTPDYWGLGFQDFYGAPLGWEPQEVEGTLAVAAIALEVDRDPATNLERMQVALDEVVAGAPDTRVVVLGETLLGWYYDPDDPMGYQQSVAQPVPGPATDALGAWALDQGRYVAFGLVEDDGGSLHNTQVLLDDTGAVAAVHRKTHLTDWDVESGMVAGDGPTLADIDGFTVGLMVCSDFESRSFIEELDEAEPDVVLLSLASGMGSAIDPTARQLEAWVVAANRWGDEGGVPYDGSIWISNPAGSHAAYHTGAVGWIGATAQVAP